MLKWLNRLLGLSSKYDDDDMVQVDVRTGKETLVRNTPEGKLWDTIASGKCPDCGKLTDFYEGPSGGMSTNIMCVSCDARFNVTPVIGRAERI